MKRVDIVIGIVIVLAAIGTAIGVTTYEDTRRGATFLVEWQSPSAPLDTIATTHTGGGDVTETFDVNVTNLTRVELAIDVATAAPRVQATSVRIEVIPPDANASQVQEITLDAGPASSTSVPFAFELGSVPEVDTIVAATPDAAVETLRLAHATQNGTGTWTVIVQFAPGAPGPIGASETHAIAIDGTLTRFEASVTAAAPEVNQG